jgi:uncharacterized protein YbdZ (MbtH family)
MKTEVRNDMETGEAEIIYRVVINDEEQYSIWPADRDAPPGWRHDGTTGTKEQCLAHIDQAWTDMRPLSLRRFMEDAQRRAAEGIVDDDLADELDEPEESLPVRLSRGDHRVEVSLRPEPTAGALREAIERGYVFVRFTDTVGGTELGVRLDRDATDVADADFDQAQGRVTIVGDLTLDFEPVRCTAQIDLATMTGTGRLALRTT